MHFFVQWHCNILLGSKEFSHQYTLMRHLPTHTDERKYTCGVCGKAFRQMSTLSQHRAIHSAERPYVCEICDKTFNRVSTLISHRKTHTSQKPHQCHLCHKAFHQKGNLRNHIFTHTNERPYKCDICNKGFNQMSNLMCHKLKVYLYISYNSLSFYHVFKRRTSVRIDHFIPVRSVAKTFKNESAFEIMNSVNMVCTIATLEWQ